MLRGLWGIIFGLVLLAGLGVGGFVAWKSLSEPPAQLAEDPDYGSTPILRLNGLQHNAAFTRAGMTKNRAVLVTTSRDNTIKMWRTSDLKLIGTIRAPISNSYAADPGSNFLWAVDIAPEGGQIAAAGQVDSDGTFRLMVFDPLSGNIIASPLVAKGFIADVAYSKDGSLLAAGIYSGFGDANNGLWIWNTDDWSVVYRDSDYGLDDAGRESDRGGRINGIAFNAQGVLITTSYDRHLRRYEDVARQTPPLKVSTTHGGWPYDLAFSPDGTQVLIGYLNTLAGPEPARLAIYDAATLQPAIDLPLGGLQDEEGNEIEARAAIGVSYSHSGKYIYAGIFANARGTQDEKVRRWLTTDPGAGYVDFDTCTDENTLQILPYQEDGAIFLNSRPCATFVTGEGEISARFRAMTYPVDAEPLPPEDPGELLTSASGDVVFLRRAGTSSGLKFDLRTRSLGVDVELSGEERASMDGYRAAAGATVLTDWAATQTPQINDRPVPITNTSNLSNNYSFSVDVEREGKFAIMGTSYYLARYANPDQPDWRVSLPANVMRTNLTGNQNAIVTYTQDGVMRWHDVGDGRVLLSLLVDYQTGRWLLWTPDGYYDASPAADDLIVWHVNNGRDSAPSWYGLSRFRDDLFRPSVISDVIAAMAEGRSTRGGATVMAGGASQLVLSKAPPSVRIARSGVREVRNDEIIIDVAFDIQVQSRKPVRDYRVIVDGRTVIPSASAARAGEEIRIAVPVRSGDRTIQVSAMSDDGWGHAAAISVPDVLFKSYLSVAADTRGTGRPSPPNAPPRPNLKALVVGVNDYSRSGANLKTLCCATADARSFAEFLKTQENSDLFGTVTVSLLLDKQANLENLKTYLSELRRANENEVILIFLAGHGVNDSDGEYYFVPYGVTIDPKIIENQTLTGDLIASTLERSKARSILFMDTCSANGALDRGFLGQVMSLEKSVIVYTSSKDGQPSQEFSNLGHGAFSYYLLQAAQGRAPQAATEGYLSTYNLSKYLRDEVFRQTKGQQEPQHFGWGPEGQLPDEKLFRVATR